MKSSAWTIGLCFAAALCLWTCVRVEMLNTAAGNILPRELPAQGNPKWRSGRTTEQVLLKEYEFRYRMERDLGFDATLPASAHMEIRMRIQTELPRRKAENELRALVGSWGILQYPIGLFLFVIGLVGIRLCVSTVRKIIHGAACLVGGIGLVMAFYRAYFTSLGW